MIFFVLCQIRFTFCLEILTSVRKFLTSWNYEKCRSPAVKRKWKYKCVNLWNQCLNIQICLHIYVHVHDLRQWCHKVYLHINTSEIFTAHLIILQYQVYYTMYIKLRYLKWWGYLYQLGAPLTITLRRQLHIYQLFCWFSPVAVSQLPTNQWNHEFGIRW